MKLAAPLLLAAQATSAAASAPNVEPLYLTEFIKSGDLVGARNASLITGLNVGGTGAAAKLGSAGFISVPSADGQRMNQLYTWLHPCSECEADAPDTPFIVWLQGGPGAPGNFGSFAEIGNYYVDENLELQERCFSWCKTANCMFIDQPTMTGYSFQTYLNGTVVKDPTLVNYTETSPEAMEQVYQSLAQVMTIWPHHQGQPLYITGESYGGVYTGNLGWVIYNHNKELAAAGHTKGVFTGEGPVPTKVPVNFVGLAVGDPVLNGVYQWPTYADTLYGMGPVSYTHLTLPTIYSV